MARRVPGADFDVPSHQPTDDLAVDRTQTIGPRAGSTDRPGDRDAERCTDRVSNRATARGTPDRDPRDDSPTVELPIDNPERYEYAGEHGRGGLGRVVRAKDARLGRTVAIKELLKNTEFGEALFVREALITARLQHPGIVPVHEAGRWPSGEPYYVMKLVSGRPLKELIAEAASLEDRLGLLPNVIAVAEAVAYAHSERVIHRDIKPANVVVGDFGETIVVDWGLARDDKQQLDEPHAADADERDGTESGPRSVSGKVIGTPQYMPPEQARGDSVDARADVYALGALLYEVLAGKAPYAGEAASRIIEKVLAGAPTAIATMAPRAPRDLVAIVEKAMSRTAEQRYPSARELAEDLRRFQRGQLVLAHDYSTVSLLSRWAARHRAPLAAAVAVVITGAALGTVAINRVVRERNSANEQRAVATRSQAAAEDRGAELLLLQAESALREDPTAAIAWLKTYPDPLRDLVRRLAVADEARSRGVAKHVLDHQSWVLAAAFSPDDRTLITADNDGNVRLWDLASGSARVVLQLKGKFPTLALRADGKALASLGAEGTLAHFDLETNQTRVHELGVRGEPLDLRFDNTGLGVIASVDLSSFRVDVVTGEVTTKVPGKLPDKSSSAPAAGGEAGGLVLGDGKTVLRSHRDGRLEIEAAGGRELLATLPKPAIKLAASPDERKFIACADDGALTLIDRDHSHPAQPLGTKAAVRHIVFSPDGASIAVIGDEEVISIWNLDSKERHDLRGHDDALYRAVFSPDGTHLASASDDGTMRLWNLVTGEAKVFRGHRDDVYTVAFSHDGNLLATASLDGTARIWEVDPADHVLVAHHDNAVTGLIELGPDRVLTQSIDGDLRITQPSTKVSTTVIPPAPGTFSNRWNLGRSPALLARGDVIISARSPQRTYLVDRATGAAKEFDLDPSLVAGAALSRDAQVLAVATKSNLIQLSDAGGTAIGTLSTASVPDGMELSLDGKTLVTAGENGLTVWDVGTQRQLAKLDLTTVGCATSRAMRPMLSSSGAWLLATSIFGETTLWNVSTGKGRLLTRTGGAPVSLEFAADESYVVGGMSDRTVRLWTVADGREQRLEGHQDLIMKVAITPDGARFASASYDKTIRVWTRDGRLERILRGHTSSVDALAFSSDGQTVYSGGRDGTVRAWDISTPPPTTPSDLADKLRSLTTAVIVDDLPRSPT